MERGYTPKIMAKTFLELSEHVNSQIQKIRCVQRNTFTKIAELKVKDVKGKQRERKMVYETTLILKICQILKDPWHL